MRALFAKSNRFLDLPLDTTPRVLLILAALMMLSVYVFPLWNLTMFAPQYQEGLRLDIFAYKLVGGNGGQDIKEINVLNHYIGMRDLVAEDFTEFKWMPFVIGGLALLFVRAAVHGKMAGLVDVAVLCLYFALFSLWSFGYKLYQYGHTLAPTAAVKVDPFMPPMFGYKQLANFEVYSYPSLASYGLGLAMFLLALAVAWGWRDSRRESAESGAAR